VKPGSFFSGRKGGKPGLQSFAATQPFSGFGISKCGTDVNAGMIESQEKPVQ
jgi:hypothetical protein